MSITVASGRSRPEGRVLVTDRWLDPHTWISSAVENATRCRWKTHFGAHRRLRELAKAALGSKPDVVWSFTRSMCE
jgi:hypothetical protein